MRKNRFLLVGVLLAALVGGPPAWIYLSTERPQVRWKYGRDARLERTCRTLDDCCLLLYNPGTLVKLEPDGRQVWEIGEVTAVSVPLPR